MSLLLALPGLAVILFLTGGVKKGLTQASVMAQLQVLIAVPFVQKNLTGYLSRAFEFSRQFLFKWTVNWRFIGEDMFSSKEFSATLLIGHATVLTLFILTKWLRPAVKSRPISIMLRKLLHGGEPLEGIQVVVARRITSRYVLTTTLTATIIGMLFARSLHYQFYALLAWATPLMLWQSSLHPVLQFALWAAQEWAWNVYPSTNLSSQIVVGVMALAVAGAWWSTGDGIVPEPVSGRTLKGK